jgi:hypothetical protein
VLFLSSLFAACVIPSKEGIQEILRQKGHSSGLNKLDSRLRGDDIKKYVILNTHYVIPVKTGIQ